MSNGSKVLIYLSFLLFLKEQYNKNLEAQRIANAKYQQKESFEKKNMTSVHEGKKPFKCDICKKRFAQV